MIKNFKIGADPELFLVNENGFVSAEGKFGGTKEEPRAIDREGFFIQEDNVMVEFNIPPSNSFQELRDNLEYMIDFIKIGAQQFDCLVSESCTAHFDIKQLQTDQANTFGCDPDFDAYTMDKNQPIEILRENLRTCGGHVHIGYDNPDEITSVMLIRALDITLGLPSLLKDKNTLRRTMYGKAGSYRIKSFGVEYRTLSNFWIFEKDHIAWVYDGIKAAIDLVNQGVLFKHKDNPFFMSVPNVINSGSSLKAINLIKNISNILKKETVCVD